MNLLLNLLALVIVAAAALYVGRYMLRVLGLQGWLARHGVGPAQLPGASSAGGGCASGCDGCPQRELHRRA